jgi:hypothetical protein
VNVWKEQSRDKIDGAAEKRKLKKAIQQQEEGERKICVKTVEED